MKIQILAVLLFLYFGSTYAQTSKTDTINEEKKVVAPVIAIKLYEGESYKWGNYCLTFKKMISDSRCPKGATCIWQGEAKVKVSLENEGVLVEEKIIVLANAENNKTTFELGKNTFSIYSLMPYPTVKTKKEDSMKYYLSLDTMLGN